MGRCADDLPSRAGVGRAARDHRSQSLSQFPVLFSCKILFNFFRRWQRAQVRKLRQNFTPRNADRACHSRQHACLPLTAPQPLPHTLYSHPGPSSALPSSSAPLPPPAGLAALEARDEEAVGLHLRPSAQQHLGALHKRQPAARPRGKGRSEAPAGGADGRRAQGRGDDELVLDWVDGASRVDLRQTVRNGADREGEGGTGREYERERNISSHTPLSPSAI